mmetsp:Transcript_39342/g.117702  ORF Transcript_39342/g.117702 Transcript_39342/m.117702 type:complete len:449 (-) Transcript_39342:27-1373(-)
MAACRPLSDDFAEEALWGPQQQSAIDCGVLKRHNLGTDLPIFSLELHKTNNSLDNLRRYYGICTEATDLMVTTSCFATWKQGRYQNGCAKVIPAVPANGTESRRVRVFFFDDNINLNIRGTSAGSSDAKGICNLRDISQGEFIDFSEGKNGFKRETAFRHTLIHHSNEYNNVMVQVNILDAMSNPHYFTSIIKKYAQADEKLIVYMDVNGTILWDDTIMGLGQEEVLLSTMMACIEVRPSASQDFVWESKRTVRLDPDKPKSIKQLVHEISEGDKVFYRSFWSLKTSERLLTELVPFGEIRWTSGIAEEKPPLSVQGFSDMFHSYMEEIKQQVVSQGMTASWFRCLEMLREGGHSVVLQSFGMDTHRVVRHSVDDERKVLHIAVNVELWSDRDRTMFAEQFKPPASTAQEHAAKGTVCGCGGPGGGSGLWGLLQASMPWAACYKSSQG